MQKCTHSISCWKKPNEKKKHQSKNFRCDYISYGIILCVDSSQRVVLKWKSNGEKCTVHCCVVEWGADTRPQCTVKSIHMTRFRGLPRNLDAVFVCAKRISHKSFDCYSIIIHIEIFAVYKPWFQLFFFLVLFWVFLFRNRLLFRFFNCINGQFRWTKRLLPNFRIDSLPVCCIANRWKVCFNCMQCAIYERKTDKTNETMLCCLNEILYNF